MKKKRISIYLFFCLLFFTFCTSSTNDFEKTIDLKNNWKSNFVANYSFKITNNKPKTISILLRNNNEYEFSNIYFFVQHTYPNGVKETDTLQYFLANKKGQWLGSGFTQIKQNLLELKPAKAYATGLHKVTVFHGMRKKNLIGLEDITLVLN
ncbi:MAG: gliding motility lipoprotein GldH [Solirubrobacteraceae bacterium]